MTELNSERGLNQSRVAGESTFRSIFASAEPRLALRVPDYQRAFSWEEKQIGFFLEDLKDYEATRRPYYFGHFIIEEREDCWEIVDGQQRITTFVLFLLVCRLHHTGPFPESVEPLLERFSTVSYDQEAFSSIASRLGSVLSRNEPFDPKHPPDSKVLEEVFGLSAAITRSQRRIILALLLMDRTFRKGELDQVKIPAYIKVVMEAHASRHITRDKSVAVNVFEMHNTRGVALTTLEVVKAVLMKFVYDHGETKEKRNEQVTAIQAEFGEIYGMEERLAERSFRGEMTTDQLLRHHLRVVDDGNKREAEQFHSPAADANSEALVAYVAKRLRFNDDQEKTRRDKEEGVSYALKLAKELKSSMWIVSEHLPEWDKADRLVGDVMILERELSCEFFLIVCRRLRASLEKANGRLSSESLKLWERFLFTRDFHDAYYRLWYKDDFPKLFSELGSDEGQIADILGKYLADGFRDQTKGLQTLVAKYLEENRPNILNNAFHWWKGKMIYALYKFEVSLDADLREEMKGSISVEHILPQEWQWKWIGGFESGVEPTGDLREEFLRKIGGYINGLGNLILLTPRENTAVGNSHPSEKRYLRQSGSCGEHNRNPERWRSSSGWGDLIRERGGTILDFMRRELVGQTHEHPAIPENSNSIT